MNCSFAGTVGIRNLTIQAVISQCPTSISMSYNCGTAATGFRICSGGTPPTNFQLASQGFWGYGPGIGTGSFTTALQDVSISNNSAGAQKQIVCLYKFPIAGAPGPIRYMAERKITTPGVCQNPTQSGSNIIVTCN